MIEPIRSWYRRTTRSALLLIVWATAISAFAAVAAFFLAPPDVMSKIQVFNGALTIPVFGALWIASFIVLWLNPSREVMFRSQESMERMEANFELRLKRIDRIIEYFEKAVDNDILGRIDRSLSSIKTQVEKSTATMPLARRVETPSGIVQGGNGNGD